MTVSGPSGTGKSSTLRLLLDEKAEEEHHSTSVVRKIETTVFLPEGNEYKWKKVPNMDKAVKQAETPTKDLHFIYAVDTGGQAAFLDIAPALLRYNSVNIVTYKLDEDLDAETAFYYSVKNKQFGEPIKRRLSNEQVLECSIRSLASLKPPEPFEGIEVLHPKEIEDVDGVNKPCFVVIGTFKDKVNSQLLALKNEKLNKKLSGFSSNAHIIKYEGNLIFPINALDRSHQEQKVADAIRREICKSYIEARIPRKWFQFHLELNKEGNGENGLVQKSKCVEIGEKFSMTASEVKAALKYFHNLTVLLFFPEIIEDVIFLDPQPLFDKLSKLIAVSFAEGANYYEALEIDIGNTAHDDMKNKGMFENQLLEDLGLQKMGFDYKKFMKLLESLQVIIQLPGENPKYFLPCVLPTATGEELTQLKAEFTKNIDPFALKWEEKIIPQGLFCALVLRLLHDKAIGSEGFLKIEKQFRNAIKIPCKPELGGSLLLIDSTTHLEIYYSGKHDNCICIREVIFLQLSEAASGFHYESRLSSPAMHFIDNDNVLIPISQYPVRGQSWLKGEFKFNTIVHYVSLLL